MKNSDVARVFEDIAGLMELKSESIFKIRAYQKAAHSIGHLPEDIEKLAAEGRLKEIPGVGDAIARKIMELTTTGHLKFYEDLKAEFPEGVSTLLDIPGIGPKTARLLAEELSIRTVDDLEEAIQSGRVAQLPHMGEKTAANILLAIKAFRRKTQRIPIGEALPVVEEIIGQLRNVPGLKHLTAAGSLRRFRETVGDIDIMGTADNPQAVIDAFTRLSMVRQVLAAGETKASVVVASGLQIDLRIVAHDGFGSLLQYFTGSVQHNINLRDRAQRLGLSLSEYGITATDSGELEKFATEEAFYRRQGLDWIPPEIREGGDEIARAEKGTLPDLITRSDIKGDLHVHSNWSDGHAPIEAMAQAARKLGYQYIAITDHSMGRGIAHGLGIAQIREQIALIRRLNETMEGFRILTGMEADVRADGSLDIPDEVLEELDIVIAAVHSGMRQTGTLMTRRVVRAMENLDVDILAHPTCRLLPGREPVDLDMETLFQTALDTDTALEINTMSDRLDLKDTDIYRARELGVKLVMDTDSHTAEHLKLMRFGVGIARRGWCEASDILNTRPLPELLALLKRHHIKEKIAR